MTLFRTTVFATALVAAAGAAQAAQQCGATTHTRFGETRAYFQNSLGACRPDGYCSVVLALPDPTGQGVYAHQFRIARAAGSAGYAVELVAVTPTNADDGQPMSLDFDGRPLDLGYAASLQENNANLFEVVDPPLVSTIVSEARRSRVMRWRYESVTGRAEARFALGGVTRALAWIDCMGRR